MQHTSVIIVYSNAPKVQQATARQHLQVS